MSAEIGKTPLHGRPMKYLLVLQFTGHALEDFDSLVELEDTITRKCGPVEWDGHDFGSCEGNIFMGSDEPARAFKAIKEMLGISCLADLRAASGEKEGDQYTILWPPDLKELVIK